MDNKEAIAVLKSNYPHGRIMISEAVDLSIKTLEAAESQTTVVQQLQAKIRLALEQIKGAALDGDKSTMFRIINETYAELSAMQ
ncbi:MAG: hypothetical protein IMZ61_02100 [Planctomycetes bacterium]|nr:hypothetical protein [Planctomycetota bacterium]